MRPSNAAQSFRTSTGIECSSNRVPTRRGLRNSVFNGQCSYQTARAVLGQKAAASSYHRPSVLETGSATGLQPVATQETVEGDSFHRHRGRHGGSMVARATRLLAGCTPTSSLIPRPGPLTLPCRQGQRSGIPRAGRRRAASRQLRRLGLDARPHAGCPTAFSGTGRGCAPTASPGRGRPSFRWGEK